LGDDERATEDFGQALKVGPNRPEFYLNIANMLSENGEYKRALNFIASTAQLGSPDTKHFFKQIDSHQVRAFLQTLSPDGQ
jgi:Tfp pilus assembly protein PilF